MVHLCRIFSVIKQFLFSHPFCILFFMFLYNIVIVLLLKKLIQYYIKICKKHTCSINVTITTSYIVLGNFLIQYVIPTPSPNDSLHMYSKLSDSSHFSTSCADICFCFEPRKGGMLTEMPLLATVSCM